MRRYFFTGVAILLPLVLTIAIVVYIFNFLTEPFVGFVKGVFTYYGLFEEGFLFLTPDQLQKLFSQFLILMFLVTFTMLLGMIARWFFFNTLFRVGEYIFHQIPFVRAIYKTSKDVIRSIFATDTRAFKQVVMIPFPNAQTRCLGLVTRENMRGLREREEEEMVAVFVPTTPNPTSGFLVMFPEHDLTYLNMSVEDAFKYIISCGVIISPFREVTREEARQLLKEKEKENSR